MPTNDSEVLTRIESGVDRITLNRPKAIHLKDYPLERIMQVIVAREMMRP